MEKNSEMGERKKVRRNGKREWEKKVMGRDGERERERR